MEDIRICMTNDQMQATMLRGCTYSIVGIPNSESANSTSEVDVLEN